MPKISDAKRRAFRIPADYFTEWGWLGRGKLILSLLALVLAGSWWAIGWARSPRGDHLISHGPVAAVHATLENDCNRCHVPFEPIRGDGWNGSAKALADSNARCQACHAGPAHHKNQVPEAAQQSCAECHRDHRGRDADIKRGTVGDCTSCHADLKSHSKETSRFAASIHGFESDHPEFRLIAEKLADPGHLKFNHAVHMKPGQGANFTYAKLDPAGLGPNWVGIGTPNAPVQLDCASCHRLDASGAYMQPIAYENDCKACHALTVEARKVGEKPAGDALAVPHGLQPDQLHALLWGAYTERLLAKQPALAEAVRNPRRLPGKPQDDIEAKARSAIAGKVRAAEQVLYSGKTTCLECHEVVRKGDAKGPDEIDPSRGPTFAIRPPGVRAVWFEHAAFSHAPHRALACLDCHVAATTSTKNADVMLPDIANCRTCHAPAAASAAGPAGGVRYDCAECHRYHGGDDPTRGLGDPARGALAKDQALREFLSGRAKAAP